MRVKRSSPAVAAILLAAVVLGQAEARPYEFGDPERPDGTSETLAALNTGLLFSGLVSLAGGTSESLLLSLGLLGSAAGVRVADHVHRVRKKAEWPNMTKIQAEQLKQLGRRVKPVVTTAKLLWMAQKGRRRLKR